MWDNRFFFLFGVCPPLRICFLPPGSNLHKVTSTQFLCIKMLCNFVFEPNFSKRIYIYLCLCSVAAPCCCAWPITLRLYVSPIPIYSLECLTRARDERKRKRLGFLVNYMDISHTEYSFCNNKSFMETSSKYMYGDTLAELLKLYILIKVLWRRKYGVTVSGTLF